MTERLLQVCWAALSHNIGNYVKVNVVDVRGES